MSGVINLIKLSIIFTALFLSCSHDRDNIYDPGNDSYIPLKAPTDFTVKAVTPKTISLVWSDINNREEAHVVFKGSDSSNLSVAANLSAGTTSWIDTNCLAFTVYFYKLAVIGALNDTHKVSSITRVRTPFTTPLDIPASSAISKPEHLKIVRTSEMTISLSWPQPDDNKKVLIMRGFKNDSLSIYKILNGSATSFSDTMHERRNHYYSISIFDSSSRSNATPEWVSPLVPPFNFQVESKDSLASCTWMGTESTTDSILLERWSSEDSLWSIRNQFSSGTSAFIDRNLKAYTEYRYRAAAFSGTVFSEVSNIDTVWFGSTIPPAKDSTTLFLCRFNQQIGDTIPEESGKTRVVLSGTSRQAGKFDQSLITGDNKFAIATGTIVHPESSLVVDFWLRPHTDMALSNNRFGILHANPGPFRVYYYQGRIVCEWKNNNGNYRAIFVNHIFTPNLWSHMVFMLHEQKSSLFINDSLVASVSGFDFKLLNRQDTLTIGAAKFPEAGIDNYRYFNGLIDEVLILSRPLQFFKSKL